VVKSSSVGHSQPIVCRCQRCLSPWSLCGTDLDMRSRGRTRYSDDSFPVCYLDMDSDCRRPAARMSGRRSLGARRRPQAAATNSAEQDMNATSLAALTGDDRSRSNTRVEARVTPLDPTGVTRRLERNKSSALSPPTVYFTIRTNELHRLGFDHSRRICDIGNPP
jgi:hypothetical protein